ncbi:hypothetical protein [Paraburkholderia sp. BCC1885]|uniref:hypothetical protein n=1 Tax=Paraburkholderia sp. BCC1885 TaxID=2562669 RepID=UPI001181FB13|nr:hypothetical protein [Paraburkholderia sp. BCC1885]
MRRQQRIVLSSVIRQALLGYDDWNRNCSRSRVAPYLRSMPSILTTGRNSKGRFEMIAFYLSLAAFGAALITGAAAVAEAKARASLQPVRIRSTDRRGR